MRTNIIVKLELEGLHNWPDAKKVFPEVAFLSDIHRHKWYITAKRDIEDYLRSKYYKEDYRSHFFGAKSCEMLATEILDLFGCCYVSVFEDNENGAEVITGY